MVVEPFRGSLRPTPSVGLELQLVDAQSLDLTSAADEILADVPVEMVLHTRPHGTDHPARIVGRVGRTAPDEDLLHARAGARRRA